MNIGLQSAKGPVNKCKTCRVGSKGRWVGVGGGVGCLADRRYNRGCLADRAKKRDSGAAGAGNGTSSTENSTKATTQSEKAVYPLHVKHNSIIGRI